MRPRGTVAGGNRSDGNISDGSISDGISSDGISGRFNTFFSNYLRGGGADSSLEVHYDGIFVVLRPHFIQMDIGHIEYHFGDVPRSFVAGHPASVLHDGLVLNGIYPPRTGVSGSDHVFPLERLFVKHIGQW